MARINKENTHLFLFVVFFTTPLFWNLLKDERHLVTAIISVVFIFLILKNKNKLLWFILGMVYMIYISFLTSEILKWPFNFQIERTLLADNLTDKFVSGFIQKYRDQALYFPFRFRNIIFNNLIYLYLIFSKFFYFLSISNLAKMFFLPNLYPLTLGIVEITKTKEKFIKAFILFGFIACSLIIGFSRSVNELSIIGVFSPLFLYLLLLGTRNINKYIYVIFMILAWIFTLI